MSSEWTPATNDLREQEINVPEEVVFPVMSLYRMMMTVHVDGHTKPNTGHEE